MKFKLIYPKWSKLKNQTEFHLYPHGALVFAATLPKDIEIKFVDENLESINFDDSPDIVGISVTLTIQIKRSLEIANIYRNKKIPVIFGGIATMLHAEEIMPYADSVFLGEAEGRMEEVIADFKKGKIKKIYNYLENHPSIEIVENARRDILNRNLYNYKGVQMVDLVHASRGCRFHCYPCAVNYLGGKKFRPRPINKAISEMASIDNNRLFIVDNSLAQDTKWEMELFKEMIPLKKKWCCHTIEDKPEVLNLAAQAGAWYVYQAIFDTSDYIKSRIKRYHDYGIGVKGTVLLGLDYHTEDYIKKLINFLLEINLDLAEFTVLTPFPHTKAFEELQKQNRIFSYNGDDYSADKVVYYPKQMSPEKLQYLYDYAWDLFYKDESQEIKMFKLFKKVLQKEMEDNTFKPRKRILANQSFGKKNKLKLIEKITQIEFVKTAIEEKSDLSEFKKKPTFQILLGVFFILISYVIGWPAVGFLGALSAYLKKPLILIIGGPFVYGISHVVFMLGMLLAGAKYTKIFLKWTTRVAVEALLNNEK